MDGENHSLDFVAYRISYSFWEAGRDKKYGEKGEEVDTYKKGPWTPTEDGVLVRYIEKHGPRNWNAVSKYSGLNRCGKSCRLRWTNHLRPDLKKGSFTQEEEEKIIRLHEQFGNKWARIAKQLAGRTDNEIKNYWNTKIKRQQRLKNNVNQPVPSSSTPTTTNDDTNTPWPVTQPLPPTCYNPPGPSPVTVSRGYPLMVRPLQVDTSACRIDTPSHQYPTLFASYGNSQPHLQRNQLPFTEVMPSSCNNFLPCDNYSSLRAALKSKAVAAEYVHLKGDMMSTVAGPMIPIQDPSSTQHNMGVTIQRHNQQQEEERRLIEQLQQRRHIQQWQQQLQQQQQQQQKQDEERQQHQQHNSRPMPTALCTDNDFII